MRIYGKSIQLDVKMIIICEFTLLNQLEIHSIYYPNK